MRRAVLFALSVLAIASFARGEIKTKVIQYKAGDAQMEGYLAWDDAPRQAGDSKHPGILVFPEWWGLTDYPKKRAEQLAGLGYVAFAVDMYGKDKTTDDPAQAGAWAGAVKKDTNVEKERIEAALDVLKQQSQVDANRLSAIGYCFGGTMALDALRMGQPLKGVVTFHGDLSTSLPPTKLAGKRVLVLTGADDKWVPEDQIKKFKEEMATAGADATVISYPGAHHAFSNPEADRHNMDNVKYNAQADKKSWDEMKKFFVDLFASK